MKLRLASLTHALAFAALLFAAPRAGALTNPTSGLVNYETAHVHPIDLTPDGNTLLAVNIAAAALEVFDVTSGTPVYVRSIPVGLDPVSVRARSNTEAWVVNQLSDSVSVVSLPAATVVATLSTDNEPADVVFTATRAFVSCADANTVLAFTLANLTAAPSRIAIAGEEPRALAVSRDGTKVFAAIFESGNSSTAIGGGGSIAATNVVSRGDGPYGGVNPPPNSGTVFNPPIAAGIRFVPVALIVKKDAAGRWRDDNTGDWTPFVSGPLASTSGRVVGWDLPDNDVAIIDTATLTVTYQKRLLNLVMAIDVNPATGNVTVVGTDAINQVRFEPILNGKFLRVNLATFAPGGAATIRDLNPHLDYSASTVAAAVRAQSLGDPRGIAWRADGSSAFITGMGSNNVAVIDAAGNRLAQIAVGAGPTGIVLNQARNRGYVLNKFAGSISVLDLNARVELQKVAYNDPTPQVIKDGRPFLYDTRLTSGPGHVSCASCHVDAKTDRLAWDLGDPRGATATVTGADLTTGATSGTATVWPMKGPMLTQTLQDIMKHPKLHWRGDRGTLADFNGAYVSLLGAGSQISAADMAKLAAFLGTIHLPPNPYRRIDDSRPTSVTMPNGRVVTTATSNALRGSNSRANNCLRCHLGQGSSTRNLGAVTELGQNFVPPAFAPFYKRLGYWNLLETGSTSGFGFFHDGADTIDGAARLTVAEAQADMLAELLTLEGPTGPLVNGERRQDTHAGVGVQMTLSAAATTAQTTQLNQLVSIATASPFAALIAQTRTGGISRGYFLTTGTTFQSDRASEQTPLADLLSLATAGQPVTFTLVAEGTERRLSVDRNFNGVFDGDERLALNVAAPGNQNTQAGTAAALQIAASDPLGGTLSYSATGLPAGLAIASGTGRISGTPTVPGTSNVTVSISSSKGGAGFASFTWTVLGQATNGFTEDFTAATLDSTRWQVGSLYGALFAPVDPLITVVQQNGRLEITPRTNTTTEGYRGLVSIASFDLRSGAVSAQITPARGSANTWLSLGSGNNFLTIGHENGTLWLEQTTNGTRDYALVTYNATAHRFWRIRHDAATDRIAFELSADGTAWTVLRTLARTIEISALRIELAGGTYLRETDPGVALFDKVVASTGVAALSVTSPGTQSTLAGTAVSLPIAASDPLAGTLSYSATGLPAGLVIASSTGRITGTPTTAGSSLVTVSVASSKGSTGSATFTWNVTTQTTAPRLADNFSAATLDATRWQAGSLYGSLFGPADALIGVTQQNGRIEITPRVNTTTAGYRGIVSNAAFDLRGGAISVEVTPAKGGADTWLAAGSGNNFLVIGQESGVLWLEQTKNGARDNTLVNYNPTAHRFWRIRHDAATDRLAFELSPDGTTWTVARTVARTIDLNAVRIELAAGTYQREAAPGTALFDNVLLQ